MFAFDAATLLLFPGLGLAALAIGLLSRRYSALALGAGLIGLLTVATASAWITAAGPITDTTQVDRLTSENGKLRENVARLAAELNAGRSRTVDAPPVDPRLVDELRTEQKRRADADGNLASSMSREQAARTKIAELEAAVRSERESSHAAERQVKDLEARLGGIKSAPPPQGPPDVANILRTLTKGSRFYTAHDERVLIPGQTGAWYVVRLLQNGGPWSFADREFTVADATAIKQSASQLRDDVLQPLLQAGKNWRLFARGSADRRRVAGPVGRDISFLPLLPGGSHAATSKSKRVAVPIHNDDLPTLRADWLREIVRPVLGGISANDIDILENPPGPDHGRTAELVLFVEW